MEMDRTSAARGCGAVEGPELYDPELARFEADCAARDRMKEWGRKLRLHEDDLRVFLDSGLDYERIPATDTFSRRQMLAYLKKYSGPVPNWIRISGLWPEGKGGLVVTAESRRKRVRALYKATVLLIRRSLAAHEAGPDRAERSIYWDPVAEVCRALEISPSKLTAFLKEHAGHSLIQVIDNVRAERVKRRLRGELREFVNGMALEKRVNAHGACLGTILQGPEVWAQLKVSRKWPEFSPNAWAQEMGFASYRRMYRACVSVYAKTPYQIEMELIEEILQQREAVDVPDFVEWTAAEIERAIAEIPEYTEGEFARNGV